MRTGLNNLPEPEDLHALVSGRRPLDWGDPIPSKAELAAKYGDRYTARSLQLLAKAAAVEPAIPTPSSPRSARKPRPTTSRTG